VRGARTEGTRVTVPSLPQRRLTFSHTEHRGRAPPKTPPQSHTAPPVLTVFQETKVIASPASLWGARLFNTHLGASSRQRSRCAGNHLLRCVTVPHSVRLRRVSTQQDYGGTRHAIHGHDESKRRVVAIGLLGQTCLLARVRSWMGGLSCVRVEGACREHNDAVEIVATDIADA